MVTITGTLIDSDTLSGIEQTPIYLNKKIVAVTDEEGTYSLTVSAGEYRLEIRPREFQYIIRDIRVTPDGRMIDTKTGKPIKKSMPLTRATL
ncbi:MAG: hypothetical protein U9R15_00570 [Chloroflexota bacterium]|nr:hypothetical protein [Chloroflexota bacterium]